MKILLLALALIAGNAHAVDYCSTSDYGDGSTWYIVQAFVSVHQDVGVVRISPDGKYYNGLSFTTSTPKHTAMFMSALGHKAYVAIHAKDCSPSADQDIRGILHEASIYKNVFKPEED
ncbi:MAG: hypothetical protein MN733_07660 [Nitrososphaera sp.]|nr:hypothetical protein [Nitrososphaera sp.]